MTKIEAIKKYLRACKKFSASVEHDHMGTTVYQSSGLLGAETRAFRAAKKLFDNDQDFINMCQEIQREIN